MSTKKLRADLNLKYDKLITLVYLVVILTERSEWKETLWPLWNPLQPLWWKSTSRI